MNKINVTTVKLEKMRMVSIYAYGDQPEDLAWSKLEKWVKDQGIILNPEKHRIFGFNNPSPSAGSSKYGYEFLISIDIEIEPGEDIRVIEFSGGLYAVNHFKIKGGHELPGIWKKLNLWVEESPYSFAHHQWLEEHTIDGVPFAIFFPIKE